MNAVFLTTKIATLVFEFLYFILLRVHWSCHNMYKRIECVRGIEIELKPTTTFLFFFDINCIDTTLYYLLQMYTRHTHTQMGFFILFYFFACFNFPFSHFLSCFTFCPFFFSSSRMHRGKGKKWQIKRETKTKEKSEEK